jgi:hypothetical protein
MDHDSSYESPAGGSHDTMALTPKKTEHDMLVIQRSINHAGLFHAAGRA